MIKVIELFAGIGAPRKALENLGIDHEIVCISEFDKYPEKSYMAMFGETPNYGDITKIERLPYADLWTYGFPCQDISNAGLQKGIVKGETRSGLLYEVQRLLDVAAEEGTLPKYLLMENVKALVGKKFKADFDNWIEYLNGGYNTYWKVLNAKDFGLPQNRERVFAVSIRKDVDDGSFKFPEPIELKYRLKDFLDEEVDEKYYLSQAALDGLTRQLGKNIDPLC